MPTHSSSPPEIVDVGVNLAHDSFDHDREQVVREAQAVGVVRMVITGSSVASTRAAIALVDERPEVFRCTAGVHPHHAQDLDAAQLSVLQHLAAAPQVAAVGECGLDYFRNFSPREAQLRAFEQQLELAAALGKPVFLHQRDAHDDFLAVMSRRRAQLAGGVAHCFTAGVEEARAYLALDLYIGVTGWICDERRGLHLREVVRSIPADRLVIETDAPYLLPRDLTPRPKSRRNEPKHLPSVLRALADARGESIAEVAAATTRNALTLFRWREPSLSTEKSAFESRPA